MDLGKDNRPFLDREEPVVFSPPALGSAEFLSCALAGAGVGTWHHDTITGLISWDAVTAEIFGMEPVAGQGEGFTIHEDDRQRVSDAINLCIQLGAPFNLECRAIRADGAVRWLHAKATAAASVAGGPKNYVAGIVADVTDRHAAEERRRAAEQRYRLISEATLDFVYEWDFASGELHWNESFARCFGHGPDTVQSLASLMEKIHPEDLGFVLEQIRSLIASDRSQCTMEHRIRKADGTYAHVYACSHVMRGASGKPIRLIGSLLDLTERKLADVAFQQSEALNRSIVEAVTECVMLISLDGKLEFINGPGARSVGIENPSALYGQDWLGFWPREARSAVADAMRLALQGGSASFSRATPTMLGVMKFWDVVLSPVLTNGAATKLVAIARDVTDRKEAEEALFRAATRDPLTGLMNRATFQEVLSRRVASVRENGGELGLMLLDLDNFKQVNDAEGHDAGDHLLAIVADRMREVAPQSAKLARLGGDEFAILLPSIGSLDDLVSLSSSLLKHIREPLIYNGRKLDCSATIGVAVFPLHGDNPEQLLKSADIALYVAKNQGRGRATMFQPEHRAEIQARLSMLSLGKSALRHDRIVPFYQPKCNLGDRHVYGFEALLRWRDPRRGIQLPSTISAAFDDLELACAISDRMIDCVIEDMRSWLDAGVDFGHVAVNASAAEFRRDDFAENVLQRLDRAGVPAKHFQLEVTETVFLGRGSDYVDRALKLLSAAGITIALDDFGTGYASLRHLKQFPVDVIKIDQSFVRNMDEDPDDAAIVGAVISLGHSLDIEVVAEGIETIQQERRLGALGCRYGQGFLYSKAIPADAVKDLLTSRRLLTERTHELSCTAPLPNLS